MANITITSTTNSIHVNFGVYSTALETIQQTWNKSAVQNFRQTTDTCIMVTIRGEREWCVTWDGASGSFQIDSINGIAPTSNSDLFTKLEALIA